jgi:small subunit ribosomal protein S7
MVKIKKRPLPNIYGKFVNLMCCKLSVNKARSEKLFLETLEAIKEKLNIEPLVALETVIRSLEPPLKTKKKKMGGKVYPLPSYLNPNARLYFAMNFLMQTIKANPYGIRNLSERISTEVINAFENRSAAFNLKDELIKTIEDNQPFQRLRKRRRYKSASIRVRGYRGGKAHGNPRYLKKVLQYEKKAAGKEKFKVRPLVSRRLLAYRKFLKRRVAYTSQVKTRKQEKEHISTLSGKHRRTYIKSRKEDLKVEKKAKKTRWRRVQSRFVPTSWKKPGLPTKSVPASIQQKDPAKRTFGRREQT